MKPPALSKGGGVATAVIASAALVQAEPIDFPGTLYEQDFDDILGVEWTYEGWIDNLVPESGYTEISLGDMGGGVRASAGGFDDLAFGGVEYPIPPIVEAGSYLDLGFDGFWLTNVGIGTATEVNPDDMVTPEPGSGVWVQLNPSGFARVEFQNLPAHESLDINLLLASGGSYDGSGEHMDGPFSVLVDGEEVLTNSGSNFSAFATPLVQGGNLLGMGHYREDWLDTTATGPGNVNDRAAIGWTLDNAYDFGVNSALTNIAHSADTLTVELIHNLTSGTTDEQVSIDNLSIRLNEGGGGGPDLSWPGGTSYQESFDMIPLAPNWKVNSAWVVEAVPAAGVSAVSFGDRNAGVRSSDNVYPATADTAFLEAAYPLAPVVEATSLADLDPRFAGNWLISAASATHNGSVSLTFTDLPEHDGVDLNFLLTASDSIDGDDIIDPLLDDFDAYPWALSNPNFRINVDGVAVFEDRVLQNGNTTNSSFDFDFLPLASSANFNGNYREDWIGFPLGEEDRNAIGWLLDAAYDYSILFDAGRDYPIAHTADSITIEFMHGLNSGAGDESISIEAFELVLLNSDGGGGGPGVPENFAIVEWERDPVVPALITVTWSSVEGATYDLERTVDFVTWETVATGITGLADKTAASDTAAPSGATGPFYRVRQTDAAP